MLLAIAVAATEDETGGGGDFVDVGMGVEKAGVRSCKD